MRRLDAINKSQRTYSGDGGAIKLTLALGRERLRVAGARKPAYMPIVLLDMPLSLLSWTRSGGMNATRPK